MRAFKLNSSLIYFRPKMSASKAVRAPRPFTSALPYELNLEVWLEVPYEEVKVLCHAVKDSDKLQDQVIKEICHDPIAWVSRAARKFKTDPKSFWYRSPVEKILTLVGSTEGDKAQSKYVELISRRGVVSDSTSFLSDLEMMRRAGMEDNYPLFIKYFNKTKKVPFREDIFIEIVNKSLLGKVSDDIKDVALPQVNVYGVGYDHPLYSEAYVDGYIGSTDYHGPNLLEYLAGLIRGHHVTTAKFVFTDPTLSRSPDKIESHMMMIEALYLEGDRDLFNLYLDTFPQKRAGLTGLFVLEHLIRTPNPALFNDTLTLIMASSNDKIRYSLSSLVAGAAKWGQVNNLVIFQDLLNEKTDLPHDYLSSEEVLGSTARDPFILPYSLQLTEWLLDNGWTKETLYRLPSVRDGTMRNRPEYFPSKAVAAFFGKTP